MRSCSKMHSSSLKIYANFYYHPNLLMVAGSQWMSANLSLAGFTSDLSAFMTCKELIENALDALSDSSDGSLKLEVDAGPSNWLISCEDSGRGFEVDSVESLVNVFSSSNSGSAQISTGKFGIGLKAMVIMSSEACKSDVVITSAIRGSGTSVVFRLRCNPVGEIVMSEPALIERPSLQWTTRVSVNCPVPPAADGFVRNVCAYLSELFVFRTKMHCEFRFGGRSVVNRVPNREEPMSESSVSHNDASGLVRCTASLKFGESGPRSISIIRFVNGVPLITVNSAGCSLLQGTVGVVAKLSASLGMEVAQSIVASCIVRSQLAVIAGPPDSSWSSLVVRINIVQPSCNIEYNCLSKDGVVGVKKTSASLPVVLGRCVRGSLKKAQSKFGSEFQSHEDFEFKCALKNHIPSIAYNLSVLCGRVGSIPGREKLLKLLNTQNREEIQNIFAKTLTDALVGGKTRGLLNLCND